VTWMLLRLGWGNSGAIIALALLPLVSLALDGASRHESGMRQTAVDIAPGVDNNTATGPDADGAVSPAG
jgi:hypothetical protein